MSEESLPFLIKPVAHWRAHARDWHRRPMLVKQLLLVAAAALVALPLLYMLSDRGDTPLAIPEAYSGSPAHTFPPATVSVDAHGYLPSVTASPAQLNGDEHAVVQPPHIEDLSMPGDSDASQDAPRPSQVVAPAASQPVTFALIMWSEHSASEGAILLKVRHPSLLAVHLLKSLAQSIMMYTSVPVDVYILCDEEAQTYVERRLALIERPRHSLRVFFYRIPWQSMLDRIEREGSISTVHAAGVRESAPRTARFHG